MAAPLPAAQQTGEAAAAVVVLAGGFNARFVSDIRAKAAEDTIERDSSLSMLRRTKARRRLPPTLVATSRGAA